MSLKIKVTIENVKNIKDFHYEFNFNKGIYALVGENAVGKSTIMSIIASTVYPRTMKDLGSTELNIESKIVIECKDYIDVWYFNDITEKLKCDNTSVKFNGIYEGSIFSGTRFEDMQNIDKMIQENNVFVNEFISATPAIKSALSTILHNEEDHYNDLYKLKNMDTARKYDLNNMPYFYKLNDGQFISKYKMSSGECMLISLLNFIISTAYKPPYLSSRYKTDNRLFIFIDEVELALHPSSIMRLVDYLEKMIKTKNITVLFSTHSSELIKRIEPNNIYYLENDNGKAILHSPCYPHYAIRSLYDHDGYDCTILVEDTLSEIIVRRLVEEFRISNNLLVNVLPVGAWSNTLSFQQRTIEQNVFGKDKFVFSIIDGDVKHDVNKSKQYDNLKKLFLPIKSVEKYLYMKFYVENDKEFIRKIGNKYFTLTPLDKIIKDFSSNGDGNKDKSGKTLFNHLLFHLEKVGVNKQEFVKSFCNDLFDLENFDQIKLSIERFINMNFHIVKKYE